MEAITMFYAQLLGIFLTVMSIGALINPKKIEDIMKDVYKKKIFIYMDGAMAILFGTILILTHNLWYNWFASLVSFVGWFTFVVGVFEIILPHDSTVKIYSALPKWVYSIINVVILILGIVLVLGGFGIINI